MTCVDPSSGTPDWFDVLWSDDREHQNAAYEAAMAETGSAVAWGARMWDEVVEHLRDADNHTVRSPASC